MAEQCLRETAKRQGLLRGMKARKLWRAKIVNVLKGHVNKEEISRYELQDDCLSLQLDVRFRSLSVIALQIVKRVRNCRFQNHVQNARVLLSNSPCHSFGDNILGMEEV